MNLLGDQRYVMLKAICFVHSNGDPQIEDSNMLNWSGWNIHLVAFDHGTAYLSLTHRVSVGRFTKYFIEHVIYARKSCMRYKFVRDN